MTRRSTEQWQALFKQHDDSGLKASEFCRTNKLCPRYFSKRKKDLGWSTPAKTSIKPYPKLVKVERPKPKTAAPIHTIALQLNDISLVLPATQPPQWIAYLVKALIA